MAMSDADRSAKLERALVHAIDMEKKALSRVKRAATIAQKWNRTRKRIEKKIGAQHLQTIVNRLSLGVSSTDSK